MGVWWRRLQDRSNTSPQCTTPSPRTTHSPPLWLWLLVLFVVVVVGVVVVVARGSRLRPTARRSGREASRRRGTAARPRRGGARMWALPRPSSNATTPPRAKRWAPSQAVSEQSIVGHSKETARKLYTSIWQCLCARYGCARNTKASPASRWFGMAHAHASKRPRAEGKNRPRTV